MGQAILSIAAIITALTGAGLGIAGFWRSARAEDAKTTADASRAGLEWVKEGIATQQQVMRETLRHQQDTITHQEGQIGELRGELNHCREERQALAHEIANLKRRLP